MKKLKDQTHGGPRKGAGRPAKEETKVIRVPLSYIPEVKKLIEKLDRKKKK